MIGDAVHNLKCALDYAWVETIRRLAPSALDNSSRFPVRQFADELEATLKGKKIHTSSPKLFDLINCKIQPHDGGNQAIWPIHRLDILDKHRLLLPAVTYTSIFGVKLQNERGGNETVYTPGTTQPPPWFLEIPGGWHVKDKGKVMMEITLDEGLPTHGLETSNVLSIFSNIILKTIELMEKL